ncbi:MAG: protein phosphatase CheZ [Janthinobacterium lividum]
MSTDLAKILKDSGLSNNKVLEALNEIEDSILETRKEISASRGENNVSNSYLPKAIDELDAVLESTEEAAHQILRAAEKIETLASWTDSTTAHELSQAVTKIYEACNFQDLAGQRIAKVIRSFHDIEQKIQDIVEGLGGTSHLNIDHINQVLESEIDDQKSLLAGPQRKGKGRSQNEIDDIFNT